MKLRKLTAALAVTVLAVSLTACGSTSGEEKKEDTKKTETTTKDTTKLSESNPMIIDKEKKEIQMLCEVNGTYFTEPTRHGIVFKDGSNGEKAVLRGLADEKEFYQALLDIEAEPGNNLKDEDMKAGADNGTSVDGEKLTAVATWDGQEEVPFADLIKTDEKRPMDLRFGGNLESAKKYNTGCVLCLDSCATGIVSDAAWPTGTTQNKVADFFGDDSVLPKDGSQVVVTFRIAE